MSHSPPVPAGNQSSYPLQAPQPVKRAAIVHPRMADAPRSRWTLLPILTASVSAAAALGAAAIMLFVPRPTTDE